MEFKDKTINIFGSKYKIKFVEDCSNEDLFRFGVCNHVQKTILIAIKDDKGNNLPPEEIKLTLYHELIHAILMTGQYLNSNKDEFLVEWLARCLNSLIKQKILC
jgi:Zn-dependent peptidase ImmA (M78 family)